MKCRFSSRNTCPLPGVRVILVLDALIASFMMSLILFWNRVHVLLLLIVVLIILIKNICIGTVTMCHWAIKIYPTLGQVVIV